MDHASASEPLIVRLREGFDRIAFVLRADLWAAAGDAGLNPAQAQVLALLAGRPAGLRPKEIAAHIGVSAASIADTLGALVRKGFASRDADPADRPDSTLDPDAIARSYLSVLAQPRNAWTWEIELRPWVETF